MNSFYEKIQISEQTNIYNYLLQKGYFIKIK